MPNILGGLFPEREIGKRHVKDRLEGIKWRSRKARDGSTQRSNNTILASDTYGRWSLVVGRC
jgi:hypothetical protein